MRSILATTAAALSLTGAVNADIKTQTITYQQGDTQLVGYMAYDDSIDTPRPAVLVVHDWTGLNDYVKMRTRKLAELGYVGFAVDMYGDGKMAGDTKQAAAWAGQIRGDHELLLARMNAALDTVRKQPQVDPQRLAIMGYCFGGGVTLETVRSGADVKAAVSFHGNLATEHPAKADTLKAAILVCHGADDTVVPQKDVAAFVDEMKNAKADWELIQFGNAVHAFTDPRNPERYNKEADERSWAAMKEFLAEYLQ